MVAPSAYDLHVAYRVFSASTVRQDVVNFGTVWSSRVFVVESDAADGAVVHAVVDGLFECLLAYAFPFAGAGA